jgi:hypothetical protein
MMKLTNMQVILLSMGAQRSDGSLLPAPKIVKRKTQVREAVAP